MQRLVWIVLLSILVVPRSAFAGPPFQTDDPDPIDYHHYEFYTFSGVDATGVEADTTGPAFELNYGPLPNLHAHIIIPAVAVVPATGPRTFGLGDIETGLKIRFIQETKWRPMVGVYPMLEIPSGSAARGLGVGKPWAHMPIWAQKSFGTWTTYGGVGETFNRAAGYRDFTYGGWELQRQLNKKVWLGGEVFSHAKEGVATAQTHSATLVDLGGGFQFHDPGVQVLFAYGRSIYGQAENYAYLGLYWTWGPEAKKTSSGTPPTSNMAQKFFSHF